ncbi:MAG TPA: dipeptidase, partial [Mycobacteriales bacterium]|nr:dipeptidase [Mycobacteriales bacterium]
MPPAPLPDLRAALAAVLPDARHDLEDLVRVPTVSADPERRADVEHAAARVADLARDAGAGEVDVVRADG